MKTTSANHGGIKETRNAVLTGIVVIVLIVSILLVTKVVSLRIHPSAYETLNPGWGVKLGNLMTNDAPDIDLDKATSRWTEGSFGKLVSLMQGNQNAPAIKNLV